MRISENLPLMLTEMVLASAASAAQRGDRPFRHWRLRHLLPASLLDGLAQVCPDPHVPVYNEGRRETNNAIRRFLNPAAQAETGAFATIAGAFQSPAMIDVWQRLCGIDLSGTYLRIEYCQDLGGFWLEPHTDIGAKRFTLLIYLTDPPPGECWGTDLLYVDGTLAERASGDSNTGVLFIPGHDTWHGFAPRPITGIRRTLIVNYVVPNWRARHELSFPEACVAA